MDFPTTGESSRGSLPTRSPSPTGDSEEDVQLNAAIEASLNNLDLPSTTGGLNGERPYRASSDHIHQNLTRDDCAESDSNTYAPQIEGVVPPNLAHIQTSSQIPARSSRKTRGLDLLPDFPLRDSEGVDATRSQADPERYVPWVGDFYGQSWGSWGLIPQIVPFVYILVPSSLIGALLLLIIYYTIEGFNYQAGDSLNTTLYTYEENVMAFLVLLCNLITGTVNLLLIFWICVIVSHRDRVKKNTLWTAIIIGSIFFGLSILAYYALIAYVNDFFGTWRTRSWPQSFRGCDARVGPQQSFLFTEVTYKTQFARTKIFHGNGSWPVDSFDKDAFQSIQSNSTLCSQGFEGNEDMYGLGIRVGIYLQWITSLVANNLLPESRKELQRVWLVFSLAVCIAIMISSFAVTCVFGIEIEILYWMYWGGFMCVFASSPSSTRLGSEAKWVVLDWVTVIQFITHMLMTYHGIMFVWYAYDQLFSRMPCGTYQFFFVPVLDPSESFSFLRDFLTQLICPLAFLSLLVFPYTSLILASEVKKSIQDSATYQMFFPRTENGDRNQTESDAPTLPIRLSLGSRILKRLRKLYQRVGKVYRRIRTLLSLPPHSRTGIRLVTPLEVKNRRYVIITDQE